MSRKSKLVPVSASVLPPRIFELIDCDRLVSVILKDVLSAVKGWLAGRPTDEIALLNRLTEKYTEKRPRCDLGLEYPVQVHTLAYELHRKGPSQKDMYGSDLAITVSAEDIGYRKTAFIQMKKAKQFQVTLSKKQLDESKKHKQIHENSFVLAANQERISVRVESVSTLLAMFTSQKTITTSIVKWNPLSEFLLRWLNCDIGTHSDKNSFANIEQTLSNYVDDSSQQLPWDANSNSLLENERLLPRSWIIVALSTGQSEDGQLDLFDID